MAELLRVIRVFETPKGLTDFVREPETKGPETALVLVPEKGGGVQRLYK